MAARVGEVRLKGSISDGEGRLVVSSFAAITLQDGQIYSVLWIRVVITLPSKVRS